MFNQVIKKHGNHLYWQDKVQSMYLHNLKTFYVFYEIHKNNADEYRKSLSSGDNEWNIVK